ncbi:MAG: TIGR04013 family B12-binding domain/radical SAM domain-containing protein [Elusimicrobia bacterium]|nr:TIGR04013 family B12-binding domain/radical SAM domain-containing protein [Elusimicrobiota bacterium]
MLRAALILYYTKPNRFSIAALAGALEPRPELRGLPLAFPSDPARLRRALRAALRRQDRVAVGFSLGTPQMEGLAPFLARLREEFPERVVWLAGGPHPSADPAGTLRAGFDLVARGEGEETLAELLARLRRGEDGRGLAGLSWLDAQGRCRSGAARPPADLDRLPPFSPAHRVFGPIEITRGCPFACGFCQTSSLFGARPRHRSPEVVAHYAGLLASRGMFDLRVVTPNAFSYGSPDGRSVDLPALRELFRAVRRAQGPSGRLFFGSMPSEVRPEHVNAATLRLMRRYAANDNLAIGAQSGSQRLLDAAGRGHSVEDIVAAVAAARQAGLKANVDFIFGLPGETEEDQGLSLALIRRLVALGARIHAHWFMPLPQTRFAALPPAPLAPRFGAELARLAAAGVLYGQWQGQESLGRRLAARGPLLYHGPHGAPSAADK